MRGWYSEGRGPWLLASLRGHSQAGAGTFISYYHFPSSFSSRDVVLLIFNTNIRLCAAFPLPGAPLGLICLVMTLLSVTFSVKSTPHAAWRIPCTWRPLVVPSFRAGWKDACKSWTEGLVDARALPADLKDQRRRQPSAWLHAAAQGARGLCLWAAEGTCGRQLFRLVKGSASRRGRSSPPVALPWPGTCSSTLGHFQP